MITIIIDGKNFNNMEGFYNEMDKVLTKGLDWETGHNLNAFNDLLWGGFGVHEYEEPIKIIWKNSQKSKLDLNTHYDGKPLFQIIVDIIKEHKHIDFICE